MDHSFLPDKQLAAGDSKETWHRKTLVLWQPWGALQEAPEDWRMINWLVLAGWSDSLWPRKSPKNSGFSDESVHVWREFPCWVKTPLWFLNHRNSIYIYRSMIYIYIDVYRYHQISWFYEASLLHMLHNEFWVVICLLQNEYCIIFKLPQNGRYRFIYLHWSSLIP